MPSLEARAQELGIPMQMKIDDGLRYSFCSAHVGTLASIEGTHAIYKGQCDNRHTYEQRFMIAELQQQAFIENGEIKYGESTDFKGGDLEEM